MGDRVFPETDVTQWVLRTKSAPLSASGTHEIVATSVTRTSLIILASVSYGRQWRRTYEVVRRKP